MRLRLGPVPPTTENGAMLSILTSHPKLTARPPRLAWLLTVAALVAALVAGCGGGGSGSSTSTNGKTTKTGKSGKSGKTGTNKKTGPKTPVGTAIKSFSAKASSSSQAQLSVTLTKPEPLMLQVRKVTTGTKTTKVGKVNFGSKPKGQSTISWNLQVAGKKLTPGRYKLTMRAGKGAGKSKPVTLTVPGG